MADIKVNKAMKALSPARKAHYEADRQAELKATGNGATPIVNARLMNSDYYQTWTPNQAEPTF